MIRAWLQPAAGAKAGEETITTVSARRSAGLSDVIASESSMIVTRPPKSASIACRYGCRLSFSALTV
jgi:hypothetical protein